METKLLNFIGGPGNGKSTLAYDVFRLLRQKGKLAEFIPEPTKDMIWEGSVTSLNDQLYIFGESWHRYWRLQNKVEFIVSDAPLVHSLLYGENDDLAFSMIVVDRIAKTKPYYNFLVVRNDAIEYEDAGRVHTKAESNNLTNKLVDIMRELEFDYRIAYPSEAQYIVEFVLDD